MVKCYSLLLIDIMLIHHFHIFRQDQSFTHRLQRALHWYFPSRPLFSCLQFPAQLHAASIQKYMAHPISDEEYLHESEDVKAYMERLIMRVQVRLSSLPYAQ